MTQGCTATCRRPGVHGSRLAQSLLPADLVDRLELVVVPTLAGTGRRLVVDGTDLRRLTLTRATRSTSGCVFLGYRRPQGQRVTTHSP